MTDLTDSLSRARELKERARSKPSTVEQAAVSRAVAWTTVGLDGVDDAPHGAAKLRKRAAEILRYLAYHDPTMLDGHLDAICEALRRGQEEIANRSRVERLGSELQLSVESQASLINALQECGSHDSQSVAEELSPLLETFTKGKIHPRITTLYLDLLDLCATGQGRTVDVDFGLLVELAAEKEEGVQESVVDLFLTVGEARFERLEGYVDELLEHVSYAFVGTQRKIARLLAEIVSTDPGRGPDYRPFLAERLDHPEFQVRASALCALLTFPGTTPDEYRARIDELRTALTADATSRRRAATDILSYYPTAIPASQLPVASLVESLDADDRVLVLSASGLLGHVAIRTPTRLADHVDEILTHLDALTPHEKYPALDVVERLAEQEPKLVAPHTDTIVDLVRGAGRDKTRLNDRIEDFTSRLQQSAGIDPQLQAGSDTLRQSKAYSMAIKRRDHDLDAKSFVPYHALGVLFELANAAPDALASEMDGLITGLDYDSFDIRRRTLVVILFVSDTHPESLFPYLGYIVDTIRDVIGEPSEADVRVGGLYLLVRVLIESDQRPDDLDRDIDPLFELLSPRLFDEIHRPIERDAILLVLRIAYSYRLIPESSLETGTGGVDPSAGQAARRAYEHLQEDRDSVQLPTEHVDALVEFGHDAATRNRARIVHVLSLVGMSSATQVALYLPTLLEWVDSADTDTAPKPHSHANPGDDWVGGDGDGSPTESDLEALVTQRLHRLVGVSDPNIGQSVGSIISTISLRSPMTLVPFTERLVELATSPASEIGDPVMLAFEEMLAAEPAVAPHAVRAASDQLLTGTSVAREQAAHVLAMVARENPDAVADTVAALVATLRTADSDATALFAVQAVARVAEVDPDAIANVERTLLARLGDWETTTVVHRDSPYVQGSSPDLLSESPAANRRTLDRTLRRTLATAVDGHESLDAWSTGTLVELVTERTGVARSAADAIVERHPHGELDDHRDRLSEAVTGADSDVPAEVRERLAPILDGTSGSAGAGED